MSNTPKVQMNFHGPVSSVAGNVEGDLVFNADSKTPAVAAAEIQELLSQLQQSNPVNLEAAIQKEIEQNPTFKARFYSAFKEASLETVKVLFAPLGIGIEAVRGWLEAE
jgi:hypothetical protein